jgi:hypothetical protein
VHQRSAIERIGQPVCGHPTRHDAPQRLVAPDRTLGLEGDDGRSVARSSVVPGVVDNSSVWSSSRK